MSPYGDALVELAGLANSEHIYMRACSVTEVTVLHKVQNRLPSKQSSSPFIFVMKNSYYVAVLWWRQQGSNL